MTPDVEIKHYYNKYLKDANNDIDRFQKDLDLANRMKFDIKKNINANEDYLKEIFNITLKDYKTEWILLQYDNEESLLKAIKRVFIKTTSNREHIMLLEVIKFCEILKRCDKLSKTIELAKKRSSLTLFQYRDYVAKFYQQGVHKCCLEGYAYHYGYGLGDLMINRWDLAKSPDFKSRQMDYKATKANKERLIAEGKIPYDKRVADVYKLRGLKYEGVPYVVYKTDSIFYDITIVNNKYIARSNIDFRHTDYIHTKLRGRSYDVLAKEFPKKEDVVKLPCDLRCKLVIYTTVDKTAYLKYIRNVEQCKYKRGAHNSKNRQRF